MIKANITWNVKQIAKSTTNGSMVFDNAIQRRYVWDKKRQSMLIDSVLRSFPIPPMYTVKTDIDAPEGCKKGSKVFDCIDGKQRCETFRAFKNNEFTLVGLDLFTDENGNEIDLNGLTYDELPEEMKDIFDSYNLTVYFFTDITDDEIADMMARLNNGKPLTGIEQARITASNLSTIIDFAHHHLFTENMTASAIESYNNEDILIKTVMQLYENQFELSAKNVKEMYAKFNLTEDQKNHLINIFDETLAVIDAVKATNNKSVIRKIVRKTNLINLIYLVAKNLGNDTDHMAAFVIDFFDNSDNHTEYKRAYNEASTNGTNRSTNVIARNEAMANAYYGN